MDFFGIAAGVRGAMEVYFSCSRKTGRTKRLVESLAIGDRIVCLNEQHASMLRRLMEVHGKNNAECVVVPVSSPAELCKFGTPRGRTIFDHPWIEEFYASRMEAAGCEMARLERQFSGYGSGHVETRMRAQNLKRNGGEFL